MPGTKAEEAWSADVRCHSRAHLTRLEVQPLGSRRCSEKPALGPMPLRLHRVSTALAHVPGHSQETGVSHRHPGLSAYL